MKFSMSEKAKWSLRLAPLKSNLRTNGLFALVAGRPRTIQEKRRQLRLIDLEHGLVSRAIKHIVATSRVR